MITKLDEICRHLKDLGKSPRNELIELINVVRGAKRGAKIVSLKLYGGVVQE